MVVSYEKDEMIIAHDNYTKILFSFNKKQEKTLKLEINYCWRHWRIKSKYFHGTY